MRDIIKETEERNEGLSQRGVKANVTAPFKSTCEHTQANSVHKSLG